MQREYNMNITKIKRTSIYEYHQSTKHSLESLFSGGRTLDWKNQPNPFRRYIGAEKIKLPTDFSSYSGSFLDLQRQHQKGLQAAGSCDIARPGIESISSLLYFGVSISAWKQIIGTNHRWALRVNASSGNLHPTETHVLVAANLAGIEKGAYHYDVLDHCLEQRSKKDVVGPLWDGLATKLPAPEVAVCLSSIFWRESWKYEQRGFRYCQHDLGHALASLSMSATMLGWTVRILSLFPDQPVTDVLGLTDTDERPLAVLGLYPPSQLKLQEKHRFDLIDKSESIITKVGYWQRQSAATKEEYFGAPNRLSAEIISYEEVDAAYSETCYGSDEWGETIENLRSTETVCGDPVGKLNSCGAEIILPAVQDLEILEPAHETIRKRRSAVDFDGQEIMSFEHLGAILRSATCGFAADFQDPVSIESTGGGGFYLIHIYLYIHRVEGIKPGLYYYNRSTHRLIPLSFGDQRELAKSVSCFQDIASDGTMAVSMVADFNTGMRLFGQRGYRLAHYEAGFIGQLFYLAARSCGYEATGIGCFLDDVINEYLVLYEGNEVIYNFTFGRAVVDSRLTTLPAYGFEKSV